jgi:CubicO group peptidase (beta-lactamase class C family)
MRRWRTDGVTRRHWIAAAALLIATVAAGRPDAGRAETPSVAPRTFSRAKLEPAGDYLRNEVATNRIPGAILLVQQHGHQVYFEDFGVRDTDTKLPMTADTIFRLYSMSKPITSVAAMMLVEDGKLALSDPLSKYIPAFGNVKVGVEESEGDQKPELVLEPLVRPITIEDLMRHTSGLTYGFYGESMVRKLYASSGLFDGDFDNAQFAERLAKLPLAEQPGTRFDYGHSVDVLGRVVEVASGQSLYAFEKARLLGPLGMTDTAFYIADPAKLPRLAELMPGDRFTTPIAGIGEPIPPRRWESGGAGMIGTIGDYARFAQMLLNRGTLDGKRYLKPETVALMTSDHIGPETHIAHDLFYFPGPGSGFGLGFAVGVEQPAPATLPLGEYRWDGVAGTFFYIDPQDDMFVICMLQSPTQRGRIESELKPLVYQALER